MNNNDVQGRSEDETREDVSIYERELVIKMAKDKRDKESEIEGLIEVINKKDYIINELEVVLSEDGQITA